jgi:hypothetical protein
LLLPILQAQQRQKTQAAEDRKNNRQYAAVNRAWGDYID